jgi:hypothetical protein
VPFDASGGAAPHDENHRAPATSSAGNPVNELVITDGLTP